VGYDRCAGERAEDYYFPRLSALNYFLSLSPDYSLTKLTKTLLAQNEDLMVCHSPFVRFCLASLKDDPSETMDAHANGKRELRFL
jgi:hypothetical protein